MLDSELIEAVCRVNLKTPKGSTSYRCDLRIRRGKTIDRLSVRMLDTARGARISMVSAEGIEAMMCTDIYSH